MMKPLRAFGILLCGFLIADAQQTPSPAERQAHWREDLQFLAKGLKAPGIRFAGGIATRGEIDFAYLYPNFDAEIASLNEAVPDLSDAELVLRIMRLIASAHVAHNTVQIPTGMGFLNQLPLSFEFFADGLGITAASPEYSAALGTRVLSIGGLKPDQLLKDIAPYISYENDAALRDNATFFFTARGVLEHFKLINADRRVSRSIGRPKRHTDRPYRGAAHTSSFRQ